MIEIEMFTKSVHSSCNRQLCQSVSCGLGTIVNLTELQVIHRTYHPIHVFQYKAFDIFQYTVR